MRRPGTTRPAHYRSGRPRPFLLADPYYLEGGCGQLAWKPNETRRAPVARCRPPRLHPAPSYRERHRPSVPGRDQLIAPYSPPRGRSSRYPLHEQPGAQQRQQRGDYAEGYRDGRCPRRSGVFAAAGTPVWFLARGRFAGHLRLGVCRVRDIPGTDARRGRREGAVVPGGLRPVVWLVGVVGHPDRVAEPAPEVTGRSSIDGCRQLRPLRRTTGPSAVRSAPGTGRVPG
jgi:hypothetical protein